MSLEQETCVSLRDIPVLPDPLLGIPSLPCSQKMEMLSTLTDRPLDVPTLSEIPNSPSEVPTLSEIPNSLSEVPTLSEVPNPLSEVPTLSEIVSQHTKYKCRIHGKLNKVIIYYTNGHIHYSYAKKGNYTYTTLTFSYQNNGAEVDHLNMICPCGHVVLTLEGPFVKEPWEDLAEGQICFNAIQKELPARGVLSGEVVEP